MLSPPEGETRRPACEIVADGRLAAARAWRRLHDEKIERSVGSPTLRRPLISKLNVLVVEDDPIILLMAAEALRSAGCHVIEAETADEGLAILRTAAASVGVVFSDIETPGTLNGLQLVEVIRETWPTIPVVLTSGFVRPPPAELPRGVQFMPKPYDTAHVATLIVQLGEA